MTTIRWPKASLFLCLWATCALAETGHWLDVPFVMQPPEGCGPASIAMVMQYWHPQPNQAAEVGNIQRALFSPHAHGVYASGMQRYFEQNGYQTFVFHGDEQLLAHHIARGRPLIVALRPGSGSQLHYVVVAGVDPAESTVLVNDPAQRKLLQLDARTFEDEWKITGHWTLLAIPRSATP